MPAPFDFPNATSNLGLPLLFTGQAQKEFFVNQSFSLIDALLHHCVLSSTNTPPADPSNGNAFRVTGTATGVWTGEENKIAIVAGGAWEFITPVEGMRIFDQGAGQLLVFRGQWEAAITPADPAGGNVIDAEARTTLSALIAELTKLGLFA